MTVPNTAIRDAFVIEFIRRRAVAWDLRTKLIAERDAAGREINRAFGIIEPDGNVSAYRRSRNPDYVSGFDAIERAFQPRYDAVTPAELAENRAAGMSVWEFLLLEEIQDQQLYLQRAASGGYVDWMAVKAKDEVDKIRGNSFAEIQRLVALKRALFQYSAARCRRDLEIRPFDLSKHAAIMRFEREFGKQLTRYVGDLLVA